jgi:hypothetical protein
LGLRRSNGGGEIKRRLCKQASGSINLAISANVHWHDDVFKVVIALRVQEAGRIGCVGL